MVAIVSGSPVSTIGTRWFSVGSSGVGDAARAGAEAAAAAVDDRDDPQLLVVFCSDAFDLPRLLGGIGEVAAGVPLIGCSTAGEISGGGPSDAGVVVAALGGKGFSVATASASIEQHGLRGAAAAAAICNADVEPREHRLLVLLSDGLGGDQQEVVRGAYGVVGAAVPLVGGCAGDGLKMERTYQLHNGRALQGSVVAAALASDAPFGIGVSHGWRKTGEPMLVTSSRASRVYTLDDRPALDVYLERLGAPVEAGRDPAAFTHFAQTHPLGLDRHRGEEVRFVGEADFDDRSLGCIAEVPQGGLAWFMEGDEASVLAATDVACMAAMDPLGGSPPLGVLAFDCIARRGVLGEAGIVTEVERIHDRSGHAPVAGFYTYGEIARTSGVTGFHNQTLVVLALG